LPTNCSFKNATPDEDNTNYRHVNLQPWTRLYGIKALHKTEVDIPKRRLSTPHDALT